MRKPIYFFIIFIISILCCKFTCSFGMEKKEQEKFVNDQVELLYTNIEALFWHIICSCDKTIDMKCCTLADGSSGTYSALIFNINNSLFVAKNEVLHLYSVEDEDVEIAKRILKETFSLINRIIEQTTDGSSILADNMQKTLQGFAKEIYTIWGQDKQDYKDVKQSLQRNIAKILELKQEGLNKHEESGPENWDAISEIAITSEIKGAIKEGMSKRIDKINSFEKKDYKKAGLHRKKHYPWILVGSLVVVYGGFGIYYGVKKGKFGEEEDKAILLVDQ